MSPTPAPLQKWTPTTDLRMLRRMGKFGEELGELQAVTNRCIIQGIDEVDPGSGRVNRQRLEDEIADVLAQCKVTITTLKLDECAINLRVNRKSAQMAEWEAMFETPLEDCRFVVGEVIRYGDGETALMRVESISVNHGRPGSHRYYGRQCLGGVVGAYESTCHDATIEDLATWRNHSKGRNE